MSRLLLFSALNYLFSDFNSRSPDETLELFAVFGYLDVLLDDVLLCVATRDNLEIIIVGDHAVNCDYQNGTLRQTQRFKEFLRFNELDLRIKEPTSRRTRVSPFCIDVLITSTPNLSKSSRSSGVHCAHCCGMTNNLLV